MKVVGETSTFVHEDSKRSQSSGEGQILSEQEGKDCKFWRAEGQGFWSCKGVHMGKKERLYTVIEMRAHRENEGHLQVLDSLKGRHRGG